MLLALSFTSGCSVQKITIKPNDAKEKLKTEPSCKDDTYLLSMKNGEKVRLNYVREVTDKYMVGKDINAWKIRKVFLKDVETIEISRYGIGWCIGL